MKNMKIQTFSIVVGGNKCNACCPYCVSKMTGKVESCEKLEEINIRNLHKACQFAELSGVSTVLLTGKGEPLLYPKHIAKYLKVLSEYNFPFIELQTNGIELPNIQPYLKGWYNLGLTTISLSCVHWATPKNKEIFGSQYGKPYQDVKYTLIDYIGLLHHYNFSVRISCVMLKYYIDNLKDIIHFINICKENNVEQFTIRPVANYDDGENEQIYDWVEKNKPTDEELDEISTYFDSDIDSSLLLELAHGAKVNEQR